MESAASKASASPGITGKADGIGKAILAALVIALVLKLFFIDFVIAEGRSMLPTIAPGTVLVVNLAAYGLRLPWNGPLIRWGTPQEGDIIVFYSPQGIPVVKRCGPVEEGELFSALGDNPEESYDSRSYGPLHMDAIIGRVVGIK